MFLHGPGPAGPEGGHGRRPRPQPPDDARLPLGDLLHRPRAGPRVPGAALRGDARARPTPSSRRASSYLYESSSKRPTPTTPHKSVLWHLTTPYFMQGDARGPPEVLGHRGGPPAREADGQDHRRVLSPDGRGRSELQHPPLARGRGRARSIRRPSPSGWTTCCGWACSASRTTPASSSGARLKLGLGRTVQAIYRWTVQPPAPRDGRPAARDAASQLELRRLAAPYFHSRLDGGEGDMLVGKALWAYHHKKAHMICELSPYSCMPNTMSIGAMAGVHRQVPRPPLRAARDQGRRRGARALALPDDPDRGQEARAARVRRGAGAHRADRRRGARLPRRPSRDEAGDLPVPHDGVARAPRRTWCCTWRRGWAGWRASQ